MVLDGCHCRITGVRMCLSVGPHCHGVGRFGAVANLVEILWKLAGSQYEFGRVSRELLGLNANSVGSHGNCWS